jgi:hypothetical protein
MSQWHFGELQQAIELCNIGAQEVSPASQGIGFEVETPVTRNASAKLKDIKLLRIFRAR